MTGADQSEPTGSERVEQTSRYRVAINERGGWRLNLGNLLRRVATRLDGRRSLAIDIRTAPALSSQQADQCIEQAVRCLSKAVATETHHELGEQVLQWRFPELYRAAARERR